VNSIRKLAHLARRAQCAFCCLFLAGAAWPLAAAADAVIVLNSLSNSISLIDPKTYKETGRVTIGKQPHHMMATPDDDALLIGNTANNQLMFIDRKTGALTHKMPMLDPYQLAFSPDRKWFVTTALRMDYVDIYNGEDIIKRRDVAKPVARVKTGAIPSHLTFTNDSKLIYVTEQGAASVAVIDVATQKVVQLTDDVVRTGALGARDRYVLGSDNQAYERQSSYDGVQRRDLYLIDARTGTRTLVKKELTGLIQVG
jgi:YVTN family beta-propeller protein